jgi:hypothetical protein
MTMRYVHLSPEIIGSGVSEEELAVRTVHIGSSE